MTTPHLDLMQYGHLLGATGPADPTDVLHNARLAHSSTMSHHLDVMAMYNCSPARPSLARLQYDSAPPTQQQRAEVEPYDRYLSIHYKCARSLGQPPGAGAASSLPTLATLTSTPAPLAPPPVEDAPLRWAEGGAATSSDASAAAGPWRQPPAPQQLPSLGSAGSASSPDLAHVRSASACGLRDGERSGACSPAGLRLLRTPAAGSQSALSVCSRSGSMTPGAAPAEGCAGAGAAAGLSAVCGRSGSMTAGPAPAAAAAAAGHSVMCGRAGSAARGAGSAAAAAAAAVAAGAGGGAGCDSPTAAGQPARLDTARRAARCSDGMPLPYGLFISAALGGRSFSPGPVADTLPSPDAYRRLRAAAGSGHASPASRASEQRASDDACGPPCYLLRAGAGSFTGPTGATPRSGAERQRRHSSVIGRYGSLATGSTGSTGSTGTRPSAPLVPAAAAAGAGPGCGVAEQDSAGEDAAAGGYDAAEACSDSGAEAQPPLPHHAPSPRRLAGVPTPNPSDADQPGAAAAAAPDFSSSCSPQGREAARRAHVEQLRLSRAAAGGSSTRRRSSLAERELHRLRDLLTPQDYAHGAALQRAELAAGAPVDDPYAALRVELFSQSTHGSAGPHSPGYPRPPRDPLGAFQTSAPLSPMAARNSPKALPRGSTDACPLPVPHSPGGAAPPPRQPSPWAAAAAEARPNPPGTLLSAGTILSALLQAQL